MSLIPGRMGGSLVVVAAVCVLLPATALAVDIKTWPFDVETTGNDVTWTSPTAVDNTDVVYTLEYVISMVEFTVDVGLFDVDVDVTDQVPPEMLTGSETVPGPPPVTVFDDTIIYPEPPEPPGVSADLLIGLDAAGFGTVSATNVFLGDVTVDVPPFGTITVPVKRIRVVGEVTAAAGVYAKGDMNCDVSVDFGDINGFVDALVDPDAYAANYPDCDRLNGDIDGNGSVGFEDINPFVDLLLQMP